MLRDYVRRLLRLAAGIAVSSLGIVLVWGALLAAFVHGLAINAGGDVVGGGFDRTVGPVLTPAAGLGALAALERFSGRNLF